jgi:hypothetical protein
MNKNHDAMRISRFLKRLEEVLEDEDRDIFVDIVQAHSIDTLVAAKTKAEEE